MEETLIPLGFFAAIALIVYVYLNSRNKERLAIIDKSADINKIIAKSNFSVLRIGIFLVSLGLGFIVANLIDKIDLLLPQVTYLSTLLLFGGAGLILSNKFEKN